MHPETKFRKSQVIPFLQRLKHTAFFPIQQLAILGDADFFLCVRGHFIALELKIVGQNPRPLQQRKLDWTVKCGGTAIVANPENWPVVSAYLQALDNGDSIL